MGKSLDACSLQETGRRSECSFLSLSTSHSNPSAMNCSFRTDTSQREATDNNHNDDRDMSFVTDKKSALTLDFNGNNSQRQKFYFNGPPAATPNLLDSTDLTKFHMSTPDVEQFLLNNSVLETSNNNSMDQVRPAGPAGGSVNTSSGLQQDHHVDHIVKVKREDRLSPVDDVQDEMKALSVDRCGPRVSPIDMNDQEAIKLARKRQRNRIAASKCRKRKLEKIAKLEEKVKLIRGENSELSSAITRLKEHVVSLRQDLMDHVKCGCVIANFSF